MACVALIPGSASAEGSPWNTSELFRCGQQAPSATSKPLHEHQLQDQMSRTPERRAHIKEHSGLPHPREMVERDTARLAAQKGCR
jgi:hypothetical protein